MEGDRGSSGPRRRRNHLLWLGPGLTVAGGLSYFMYFARFPSLRDVPWVNLPIVTLGLVLSGIGVRRAYRKDVPDRGKIVGPIGLLCSLGLALLFCFYIFSFSYGVPAPTATTLELVAAPAFTLPDQEGRPVRLRDLRGRKVVLTFYRGFW